MTRSSDRSVAGKRLKKRDADHGCCRWANLIRRVPEFRHKLGASLHREHPLLPLQIREPVMDEFDAKVVERHEVGMPGLELGVVGHLALQPAQVGAAQIRWGVQRVVSAQLRAWPKEGEVDDQSSFKRLRDRHGLAVPREDLGILSGHQERRLLIAQQSFAERIEVGHVGESRLLGPRASHRGARLRRAGGEAMILWGWGKRTVKHLGQIRQACPSCQHTGWFNVVTIRTWFTLFFIPVIPYRVRHVMMCTNCGGTVELDAERMAKAKQMIAAGDTSGASVGTSYDEQVAAYEEQMAAQRRRLAGTQQAEPVSDADRLRARMEQRNPNWNDRR